MLKRRYFPRAPPDWHSLCNILPCNDRKGLKMSKVRQLNLRVVSSDRPPSKGKVVHDARGNAVWQWQQDAAELDAATSTGILRTLSGSLHLSLEEGESAAAQGAGNDPYNSGSGGPNVSAKLPPAPARRARKN
jgi:hypothetical protein